MPKSPAPAKPFWREKALDEMSTAEWESLCDGCARCCLNKLEDVETGEIAYTNVACRLLEPATCRCTNYAERQRYVPDCVALTPKSVNEIKWLPSTCAYRILADGGALPAWHPLVSGDPRSVVTAGISVLGKIVSEREAQDLEDHVVEWPA